MNAVLPIHNVSGPDFSLSKLCIWKAMVFNSSLVELNILSAYPPSFPPLHPPRLPHLSVRRASQISS